jgi:hypothetical protein
VRHGLAGRKVSTHRREYGQNILHVAFELEDVDLRDFYL